MKLHLSSENYNNEEYTNVNFSPDTKKSLIYDFRSSLKDKQNEELIDLKGQEIFLAKKFAILSLRQKLIYYSTYENLDISFDKKVEELFRLINKKSSLNLEENQITEILKTNGFIRNLEKFQLSNLKKLLSLNHGMNFSVPGAGKTSVTLALHTILKNYKKSEINSLLIIAPKNAFGSWDDEVINCYDLNESKNMEITRLSGSMAEIANNLFSEKKNFIINYERVPIIKNLLSEFLSKNKCHLILDESHRIKSQDSERAMSIRELSTFPVRKDILTGTPITLSEIDLENQWFFLYPDIALPNINEFKSFFVRTTKKNLKLSTINRTEKPAGRINVEMSSLQQNLYSKILIPRLSRVAGQWNTSNLREMRKCIIQLMQASSNPHLLTLRQENEDYFIGDDIDIKLFGDLSREEFSPKLYKAAEIARNLAKEGKKTLIWSYFVHNVEALATKLLQDLNAQFIHGGVDVGSSNEPGTREFKIKKFKNDKDCMVMVANFAACSEGISLHKACHNAIYIDRSFQAGQYIQSENRIHRLGNYDNKNIYYLESVTSSDVLNIDYKISKNLQKKIDIMDKWLNDEDLRKSGLDEDDSNPFDYNLSIKDLEIILEDYAKKIL
jgi:hypothetical protein